MFTKQEVIYLAGGCFWGVEAFISRLKGVNSTEVGYSNGNDLAPTYEKVCSGKTGHAETVKATYNPKIIALDEILESFFKIIDPHTRNRQGPDIGTQYRTGIYWQEASQRDTVIKFLTALVVLLLLALGAGIYYFTHQLALRDNYIHQLETIAVGDSSVVASQEKTQAALPDTTAKVAPQEKEPAAGKPAETQPKEAAPAAVPAPAASAKAETPKPAEKPVEKKAEKPAEKVMSQYDSDPRIRLGAYDIVGTETTVTVQQGQTLQSISKAHLGPGMECYVEALNGVKAVKTGDKVKIPKLQLKKKKK